MPLTAKPTYKSTARVETQTKPRRERVRDRRTVATKQLQAIIKAWDAWDPDNTKDIVGWVRGCNNLEFAIDAARAEMGGDQ